MKEILQFFPGTRICTQIFPSPSGPIKYQTNDTDTAGAAYGDFAVLLLGCVKVDFTLSCVYCWNSSVSRQAEVITTV